MGSIAIFPTHQEALPLIAKAVTATAKAAGLKRCFFLITTINLKAIARVAAQPMKATSVIFFGGVIIRPKIRAVIQTDSTFVGASKTFAKSQFET